VAQTPRKSCGIACTLESKGGGGVDAAAAGGDRPCCSDWLACEATLYAWSDKLERTAWCISGVPCAFSRFVSLIMCVCVGRRAMSFSCT
jgi:hypothetical protein